MRNPVRARKENLRKVKTETRGELYNDRGAEIEINAEEDCALKRRVTT